MEAKICHADLVRASSVARGWNGLIAACLDTVGGPIEHDPAPYYRVGMHVGAPVVASGRSNGTTHRRLQVPGDMHVVPFGASVAWEDNGPTQYLGISLMPSLMHSAAEAMEVNIDAVALPSDMQLRDEKLAHIALAIKAELEVEDPHDRMYAEGLGLSLAVHLLRRYGHANGNGVKRGLTHRQVHSVQDYIHEHLMNDLSLGEVASLTSFSPSHFKVLFKQSVGLPVHQYVIKCRVDRAVELLTSGDINLSEVALKSGFADQSHMSRCMRRLIGLTPGEVMRSVS